MSDSAKAVFLSYASQDAEAAKKICDALRAAGIEVWFDQSELRGGDAWDQKIRKQIKECALFVPIISANTQARTEGYFRLEWRLADQRTHLMARGRPFLLPVVTDDTRDNDAHVPDSFLEVQWTRLAGGEMSEEFCERVKRLLVGEEKNPSPKRPSRDADESAGRRSGPSLPPKTGIPRLALGALALLVAGGGLFFALRLRRSPEEAAKPAASTTAAAPRTEVQRLIAQMWAVYDKSDDASDEDWTLAEELGARAVSLEPGNAEAWALAANIGVMKFIFLGGNSASLDRATKAAERAASLAPASLEARFALANCYRMSADTRPEAVRIVRELVGRYPQDRRVLRLAGNTLRRAVEVEEAIGYFDRASALPGGDTVALFGKERTLMEAGRFREAEAVHEQIFARDPGPAAYLRRLFYLLYVHDDLDGAVVALAKIPGSFLLRSEGASHANTLWLWRREPEKLLAVLERYSGDELNGRPKGFSLGQAHMLAGNMGAAQLEWRAALKKVEAILAATPTDLHALYWRAFLLASLGDKPAATRAAQDYEQMTLSGGVGRFDLALLMVALGDYDRALTIAEAAAAQPQQTGYGNVALRLRLGVLRHDPLLDPLRGMPRFQALLARLTANFAAAARLTAVPASAPASGTTSAPSDKSVAVLAFRQLGADPENEYLCEAISDELCNALGRMRGLKVAASASAFSFKGKQLPPAEMAAQLGVTDLVDGTVQKIGDRVRVRAQLINAADGFTVWSSDTLDHEAKDMFAVEDAVVGAIAKSLQLQLGASVAPPVVNPEAYRLYYEGRRAWSLRASRGQAQHALDYFQKAIDLDPTLGRAYAGLADASLDRSIEDAVDHSVNNSLYFGGAGTFSVRQSEVMKQALALAAKAVQLEPDSAEAHTAQARAFWLGWRLAEAEAEARRALELNPSFADAHLVLARLLDGAGRVDEALVEARRAIELDPLTSRNCDNAALLLINAGRYTEALAQVERALALQPDSVQALRIKSEALSALGRHEEAVALARRPEIAGSAPAVMVLLNAGLKSEAEKETRSMHGAAQACAAVLVALGRTDDAFKLLQPDNASALGLGYLFYRPELDPIRRDPRFVRYLERLGLTEAHARAQAWRAAHPPEKPETKT